MTSSGRVGLSPCVVGIGEALFDVFDDEARLGGAPLNVAVHAHRLLQTWVGDDENRHAEGVVVSRVGQDALGDRIVSALEAEGMLARWVQRDAARATGRVTVERDEGGGHTFRIEPDAAWDALAWDASLLALAKRATAVAFGSLAQREASSRETIQRFVSEAGAAVKLFDVNLRSSGGRDFFDAEAMRAGAELADYLKLNDEEQDTVCGLLGVSGLESAMSRFGLSGVVLTRGSAGTAAWTSAGWVEGRPASETLGDFEKVAGSDTVGAGDSCSAAILASLSVGHSMGEALDLANAVAAYVAHQPGATPSLPAGLSL